MNYVDKLNKLKNNLDGLEDKSKDELIEFVTLIINMSIVREEGNSYVDSLAEIAHKNEIESWRRLSAQVTGEFTEEIKRLEDVAGYQLDDLTEKLKNGELKIIEGE